MYHYVSIVYLIYRFCGRTTCGYARYLQQKQLGRQCRWRRSWCCREMLPRQTSWWPRRWRDPLRHHRQDEVVRWRWWRRSQLQWQQELEGWRRERLHGMMDGVGWYRMRCQSVLERICQGNLFFFLVHFLIICLVFEKSQGSAPRWQRWRWRRIQLWFETKFQHQEVHRQQRQEKHRWWRPTGTGTGWFFLLPLLKNTAGKSQMKLKDIESVYIYVSIYRKYMEVWCLCFHSWEVFPPLCEVAALIQIASELEAVALASLWCATRVTWPCFKEVLSKSWTEPWHNRFSQGFKWDTFKKMRAPKMKTNVSRNHEIAGVCSTM